MSLHDEIDVGSVLQFIAEHEPLTATLQHFRGIPDAALRVALKSAVAPRPHHVLPKMSSTTTSEPPAVPTVVVYSDGASRGNPGPAGAGWVICDLAGKPLARGGVFLGRCTNNEAEYMAAAMGLKAAEQFGCDNVVLRADSELLVRQLQGRYKVRNTRLLPLYEQVKTLSRQYRGFRAEHVPRAQNAAADEQANLAIDTAR